MLNWLHFLIIILSLSKQGESQGPPTHYLPYSCGDGLYQLGLQLDFGELDFVYIQEELITQYEGSFDVYIQAVNNCEAFLINEEGVPIQCLACQQSGQSPVANSLLCQEINEQKYAAQDCILEQISNYRAYIYTYCDDNCLKCENIVGEILCTQCHTPYYPVDNLCIPKSYEHYYTYEQGYYLNDGLVQNVIGLIDMDSADLRLAKCPQYDCLKCSIDGILQQLLCVESVYTKRRNDQGTLRDASSVLNYFIKPDDSTSLNTDYMNFGQVLSDIQTILNEDDGNVLNAEINVFFMNADTVNHQYLLDYTGSQEQDKINFRLFERVKTQIKFAAATSENCGSFSECLLQDYYTDVTNLKPIVVWRNHHLFFHVTDTMIIKDIEFNGGDLILNTSNNGNELKCLDSQNIIHTDCFDNEIKFKKDGNLSKHEIYSLPEGLFRLEYLIDYLDATIPQINIQNCIFTDFFAHQYAKSLISFRLAGYINIENTVFKSMFFQFGIITNSLSLTPGLDRISLNDITLGKDINFGHFRSETYSKNCRSFAPQISDSTDCHQISINLSTFSQYNSFGGNTKRLNKPTELIPEGMVVSLQNVDGKIKIQNSVFEQLVTSVLFDIEDDFHSNNEYNCKRSGWFPTFNYTKPNTYYQDQTLNNINYRETINDISATSSYKIQIDKHVRKYLSFKREIGSVLHIRNVKKGLILYKNTFNENIGTGGTNLLVEGFENTLDYPIIIDSNTFSNNFAYHFAPSFSITSNSRDFIHNQCQGFLIQSNIIKGNMGCNQSFGNMIVSCEFSPQQFSEPAQAGELLKDKIIKQNQITEFETFYQLYSFATEEDYSEVKMPSTDERRRILQDEEEDDENYVLTKGMTQLLNWYKEAKKEYNQDEFNSVYRDEYYSHPDHTQIYSNQLTVTDNTCENNYGIISNCLYIQGFMNVFIENNTFQHNSVPIQEIVGESSLVGTNAFYTILGLSLQKTEYDSSDSSYVTPTYAKESSPLLIRYTNLVEINNNTFKNNSAIFSGDFYIASGITLDQQFGIKNVTLTGNTFSDHQGINDEVKNRVGGFKWSDSFCNAPLISFSFLISPVQEDFEKSKIESYIDSIDNSYNFAGQPKYASSIILKDSQFTNNQFNIQHSYEVSGTEIQFQEVVANYNPTDKIFEEITIDQKVKYIPLQKSDGIKTYQNVLIRQYTNYEKNSDVDIIPNIDSEDDTLYEYKYTNSDLDVLYENSFVNHIAIVLDDLTIEDNINHLGTSFFSHGTQIFEASNINFARNEIKEIYNFFGPDIKNTNSTISMVGAYIYLNSQISSVKEVSQNIFYESFTFDNNKGILVLAISHEIKQEGYSRETKIENTVVTNHHSEYSYLIIIEASSSISIDELNISTSTAFSMMLIQSASYLQIKNIDFQNNIMGNNNDFQYGSISELQTNLGFSVLKSTTSINFENIQISQNTITDTDFSELSEEQLDFFQIGTNYTKPYTVIDAEFSEITITNLVLDNNVALIALYAGQESVVKLVSPEIKNTPSQLNIPGSDISFTNSIWAVATSTLSIKQGKIHDLQCSDCISAAIRSIFATLILEEVEFYNIQANEASVLFSNSSDIQIFGCNFHNNAATNQNSILQAKLGSLEINEKSGIYNNFKDNQSSENMISTSNTYVVIAYSNFINNFANKKSKNIFVKDATSFTISYSYFEDYNYEYSESEAAFLYLIDATTEVNHCIFKGANSQKGAIFVEAEDSQQIYKNNTFQDCQSKGTSGFYGGGIVGSGEFQIQNCTFTNITSSEILKKGGSALQLTSSASVDLSDCIFNINSHYSVAIENVDLAELKNIQIDGQNLKNSDYGNFSGGILINSCQDVQIDTIKVQNCKNAECGGGLAIFYETAFSFGATQMKLQMNNLNLTSNQAINGGGLCIYFETTNLPIDSTLNNSQIKENSASKIGGGIYYDCSNQNCELNLENAQIEENSGTVGAGGIFFQAQKPQSTDEETFIQKNSAPYGPDIGSYPILISEKQNIVTSDFDWYVKQNNPDSTDTSRRNLNSENQHQDSLKKSNLLSDVLELRRIQKAQDIFLKKQNNNSQQEYSKNSLRRALKMQETSIPQDQIHDVSSTLISGQYANPPPIFLLVDEFGQVVSYLNSTQITISAVNVNLSIDSGNQFTAINGMYIVYPLKIKQEPDTTATVKISSDGVKLVDGRQQFDLFYVNQELEIQMKVRKCLVNERWSDTNECLQCASGKMNIFPEIKAQQCEDCPTGGSCEGRHTGPKPTYWRKSDQSRNFIQCDNQDSCLGAQIEDSDIQKGLYCDSLLDIDSSFCVTGWCAENYQGNLCNTCAPGYAKSQGLYCKSCSDDPWYYIILALIVVCAILVVVITIRDTLSVKKYEPGEPQYNRSSVLMKIIMNYFQLVAIVATFDFNWPLEVRQTLEVQQIVTKSTAEVFSFDCFLNTKADQITASSEEEASGGISTFFMKLLMVSISPFIFMAICILFWALRFLCKYAGNLKEHFKTMKANTITSVIVILFLIHTTIIETTIKALRCRNLGDESSPENYMYEDYDMECWTGNHLYWVISGVTPSLGLWGILAPLVAFIFLKKNQNKLEEEEFKRPYGFLYLGYKNRKYFWEFIILYRKMAMIFVSVFMASYSVQVQAICILGVGFVAYVIHLKNQPFIEEDLNLLEKKSLLCATITLYAGLYYLSEELGSAAQYMLFVIIITTNIVFFVHWLKAYSMEIVRKLGKSKFFKKYLKNKNEDDCKEDQIEYEQILHQQQQQSPNNNMSSNEQEDEQEFSQQNEKFFQKKNSINIINNQSSINVGTLQQEQSEINSNSPSYSNNKNISGNLLEIANSPLSHQIEKKSPNNQRRKRKNNQKKSFLINE